MELIRSYGNTWQRRDTGLGPASFPPPQNKRHQCTRLTPKSTSHSRINNNNPRRGRLLVTHQGHDHSIQVEEEHQQVETQLEETLLLVLGQGTENLRGVQQVVFLDELVGVVS